MPYFKLEYSANIKEKVDLKKLFSSCHDILVNTINADLSKCVSRAISYDNFHVGSGQSNKAFIYLEISLLEGRLLPKLQEMGEQILKLLESYFTNSIKDLNTQISVRVVEFSSSHYFRTTSLPLAEVSNN